MDLCSSPTRNDSVRVSFEQRSCIQARTVVCDNVGLESRQREAPKSLYWLEHGFICWFHNTCLSYFLTCSWCIVECRTEYKITVRHTLPLSRLLLSETQDNYFLRSCVSKQPSSPHRSFLSLYRLLAVLSISMQSLRSNREPAATKPWPDRAFPIQPYVRYNASARCNLDYP